MRTRARVCVGAWVRVCVRACVRVRAFCARVRLRALRTEAMAQHSVGKRDTSMGGYPADERAGSLLTEDYHNASALSGTTCALQSVNRAGNRQRTHDL